MAVQFKDGEGNVISEYNFGDLHKNETSGIVELIIYNSGVVTADINLLVNDDPENINPRVSKTEDPFTADTELNFNDVGPGESISFYARIEVLEEAEEGTGEIVISGNYGNLLLLSREEENEITAGIEDISWLEIITLTETPEEENYITAGIEDITWEEVV